MAFRTCYLSKIRPSELIELQTTGVMTDDELFVRRQLTLRRRAGGPRALMPKLTRPSRRRALLMENRRGNAKAPKKGAGSVETLIISPGTVPRRRSRLNKVLKPTSKDWFREGQPDSC